MSRIEGTRVGTEPHDLDEAAATPAARSDARGEPQPTAAGSGDRLEAFARKGRTDDRVFREMGELRAPAEQLRSAFEHLGAADAAEGGNARKALRKLGAGLCRCAEWTGNVAQGVRVGEATSRVDRALDAYQRQPNAQNARELQSAMSAWNAAVGPVAERIPLPHVAASLSGMLDAGTRAIGSFAVLVTDRAERAMAASLEDPPAQASAPVAAAATPVEIPDVRPPPPPFEALPEVVRGRVEGWAAAAGLERVPARVERSLERFEAAHAQLAAAHAEAGRWWRFSGKADAERESRLQLEMRSALMQLGADASSNLRAGPLPFADLADVQPGR